MLLSLRSLRLPFSETLGGVEHRGQRRIVLVVPCVDPSRALRNCGQEIFIVLRASVIQENCIYLPAL